MSKISFNGIDREMNEQEQEDYDAHLVEQKKKETALVKVLALNATAKASGAAKLAALGFTEAEIAAW